MKTFKQVISSTQFQVGDKVRNTMTGKTYKVREILKTVAIIQRGSTAIKVKLKNLEFVSHEQ